jgi:dTDP-4-dehydrorhamnose 3,5-epimerase-like enzyme
LYLSPGRCVVFYTVDKVYSANHDRGVHWADLTLGIEWPIAAAETACRKAGISEATYYNWLLIQKVWL